MASPNADVVIRTTDNSSTADPDVLTIYCETAAQAIRAVAVLELYAVPGTLRRSTKTHIVTAQINPRYTTSTIEDEVKAAAIVADLAIEITAAPTTAAEGANIVFTITATNNGPDVVDDVAANVAVPTGLTATANAPASGTSYSAPTWTIGALASGASKVLTITADADAGQSGNDIDYVVSVSGTRTDGTSANNTDTQTVSIS